MVENLKVTKYRNGDAIPNITDNAAWISTQGGAYCNYDNIVANGNTYGRLYNFYAVTDSRNIAPSGWHVPSDAEWTTLTSSLGSTDIVGGNLKESGTTHWSSPNTGADNSSGFTGLPGGRREYIRDNFVPLFFSDIGRYGFWWSTTKTNDPGSTYYWNRQLYYNSRQVSRRFDYPVFGLSVRCVKD